MTMQVMSEPSRSIVAVLTCFNRKAHTLTCLEALETAARHAGVHMEAIVVDDASPDGTAAAVRERFPWAEVIDGPGDLFWSRGMHLGFGRALQRDASHILWLNDDTQLVPQALARLLSQAEALHRVRGKPSILIGATAERSSGAITYGGRVATSRWRPFRYQLIHSEREPLPCVAMEGNCVLIPRAVAQQVGNIDPLFEHAMGDTDYGLRARAAGFDMYVAAGVVGYCSTNPIGGTYFDNSLSLAHRWRLIRSRKGLPVRSWLHFSRRHGGLMWPVHFAWPYAKVLLSGLLSRGSVASRSPRSSSVG
jgi:GT2 family glycosyltransferase